MKIRVLAAAVAALSLATAPAIAQVSLDRATVPVSQESDFAGGAGAGVVLGILALGAIIAATATAANADGENPEVPGSP